MNIALYLSLPDNTESRLTLLSTLVSAHCNDRLNMSAIFLSGVAARLANDSDSELYKILARSNLNVAICSTSADSFNQPPKWPVDGLGFWVEASTSADRAISL